MLAIANLVAYLITLAVNFHTSNRVKEVAVAKKQITMADPHPYAFSIWALIYAFMGAFVAAPFFSTAAHLIAEHFGLLFIAACALNCAWLFAWTREQWVLAEAIIWVYCVVTFFLFRHQLPPQGSFFHELPPTNGLFQDLAYRTGLEVHFGWLLCAATVSVPVTLKALLGVELGALPTCALFAGLALFARFGINNHMVSAVVAWALWAVHYNNVSRQKAKISPSSAIVSMTCVLLTFMLIFSTIMRYVWGK